MFSSGVALFPVYCLLAVIDQCNGQFGRPINHGVDRSYETMGQASIGNFQIEDGMVSLDVVVEDAKNEDELWILDFQPYTMLQSNHNLPVVNRLGGYLLANNTGPCSSVFASESFKTHDFYDDTYRPGSTDGKNLFTSYTAGAAYATKAPGDTEKFRDDTYSFSGTINTLFDCVDSNGNSVWQQTVYPESIQLNTTLYMTNVRPKYDDGSVLPSYTQNYAVLYWTLMRFALSRFLISSTDRLRPIFEYAVVKPVYINADESQGLDRSRAEVDLVFRTVTDSDGYLISVYRQSSLQYNPVNTDNGLSYVSVIPDNGCSDRLGMESNAIPNVDISASTFLEDNPPHSARLNGPSAWSPSGLVDQYIEVGFPTLMTVTGLITQGFAVSDMVEAYVKSYKVEYSFGGTLFTYMLDSDSEEAIYYANFDADTPVPNYFINPLVLRAIRIVPVTVENFAMLRFEILGCDDILEANNGALTAPACDFTEYPGKCTQRWMFGVVLDVDVPMSAESTQPLDATGEFELQFQTYTCPDIKSGDKSTCVPLDVPDAIISNLISLQSVVDIEDGEIDEPRVLLKRVYGALNPNTDLRDGYSPGVSHLEMVYVESHFFPEVLRQRLELELTLFMVCIGNEYAQNDMGCLAAPDTERYSAYIAEDFFFEKDNSVYTPSIIEEALQSLESHSYDRANEKHVTTFVNRALSGQSRNYTITNVFQLVELNGRRKRAVRRDVLASISSPGNLNFRVMFTGCPEGSTHDIDTLECICDNPAEIYSDVVFECVPKDIEEETNIVELNMITVHLEVDNDSGSQQVGVLASVILAACVITIIFA